MPGQTDEFDLAMMRRAIRLAMNGRGKVEPNPMVGCVLVKDGQVIGEGYHEKFGSPHAEPTALSHCTQSPRGATAYVTLEPCCHQNKKTPPCVPALIDAHVARVVVGCVDPNPDVNGKGLDLLRAAGIEVVPNVMNDECKQLLAPFIATTVYERPYVTLKWAESADGKVAGVGGARVQISNSATTQLVHEMRARSDAIMVGINTVLCDDPLLTARRVFDPRPLARIVLDSNLKIPSDARIVQDRSTRTIVYTDGTVFQRSDRVRELQELGVEIWPGPRDADGKLNLANLMEHDGNWNPVHLLVEPGPTLAENFFGTGFVDRVWVIRSSKLIGNSTAPTASKVPEKYVKTGETIVEGDVLSEYLNPRSEVYFAPEKSADFLLAEESTNSAAQLHG